jgi:D-ribose pyranose/furanose isomerase RbsD
MKTINVVFEDLEFRKIIKAKEIHGGNLHDFIIDLCRKYYSQNIIRRLSHKEKKQNTERGSE